MNLIINNRLINAPLMKILKQVKSEITTGKLDTFKEKHDNVIVTCPFHKDGKEAHPSCNLYCGDDSGIEYGWFKCFTCGETGPLTKFIGECFNANTEFGKEWLLERFGNNVIEKRPELLPISFCGDKAQYLDESILESFQNYHPYMTQRKLTSSVIDMFKIKYDMNTRSIVFPVWDDRGKLLMLTRRSVENKTFIIDEDKEKPIYLLNFIRQNDIKSVCVCESQINCLTCFSYNIPAIALFGTGAKHQYEILRTSGIRHYILCFDGDDAGRIGANKFFNNLKDSGALISDVIMPKGKDVNDLTKEEFLAVLKNNGIDSTRLIEKYESKISKRHI